MYAWLWRHLPGTWITRTISASLLTAAIITLLLTVVFPWVDAQQTPNPTLHK